MLQTFSGREEALTVAFRVPIAVYEEAAQRARQRGVKLSVVLREATAAGLAILLADDGHLVADPTQMKGALNG